MFTEKKYRAKSKEYGDLIEGSDDPGQIRKLQDSKDSFSSLSKLFASHSSLSASGAGAGRRATRPHHSRR